MRNHRNHFALLFVVVCLGVMTAFSSRHWVARTADQAPLPMPGDGPVPLPDLQGLTRDADVIVVAQVTSVWETGSVAAGSAQEGRRMAASLNVEKVIKGRVEGPTLALEFTASRGKIGRISASQFGMFFLRKDAKGGYSVLNPYYPSVVASRNATTAEGTDIDRVVAELADILTVAGASAEERRLAVFYLNQTLTDSATEALRSAVRDRDSVVRLQAVASLLNRNDLSALRAAEEVLLNPPPRTDEYLRTNISVALEGIKDARAIPTLGHLLKAGDVQTRRGAAAALRHMGTALVTKPLIYALNDSDREVRYQGVIGLAEITGQSEWGPSVDLFQHAEQRYLDHWREWAKTQ